MDLIAVSLNGFCVYLGTTLGQVVAFVESQGFTTSIPSLSRNLKDGRVYLSYLIINETSKNFEVLTITKIKFDVFTKEGNINQI